jgi:hypothetical protein
LTHCSFCRCFAKAGFAKRGYFLRAVGSFMYDLLALGVPRRTKGFMKRISALVGVLGLLALGVPTAAMAAGSSTCQAYSSQACQAVTTTATTSAGTLPFTGLDVVLLVAGGGTLLAAGFVVRRLSRRLD